MKHHPIFREPITCQRELINCRVLRQCREFVAADGVVFDEMEGYYSAFAIGGFGAILTEGLSMEVYGSQSYNHQPTSLKDFQSTPCEKVTHPVHQSPSPIVVRLIQGNALNQTKPSYKGTQVLHQIN